MKLLIVDDSLVVRNAIERCVSSHHISESFTASDGSAAMELFHQHVPELVTMDLTLPGLDGLSCIASMCAEKPDTSILVISALNSHQTAMEAINRGACGFLVKPFTDAEVEEALNDLVQHALSRLPNSGSHSETGGRNAA